MKLNKIVIEDFGPYRGRNEFDLTTSPESPIVLFGGMNGAGKTTLFTAIQICLHGRSALGQRISEKEYKNKIEQNLHNYADSSAESASIRLEFEYAHFGEVDHYTVVRSWRDRGKSIVENLEVKRNGKAPGDLDEDQWQDFLKELIPPGVSELFFFDGEKIQELASAIEDDDNFKESLFSLLGLEMIDRLDADLSIYIQRKLNESDVGGLSDELNALRSEQEEIREQQKNLKRSKVENENGLAELEEKISQKEDKLSQEGGSFAEKREELKEKRAGISANVNNLEERIQDLATGAYPFALAPDLCQNVRDRLQNETKAQREAVSQDQLKDELDTVLSDDELWKETDIGPEEAEKLTKQIQENVEDQLADIDSDVQLVNQFSEVERQQMYSVVDKALNDLPPKLGDLTVELEAEMRRHRDIERQLGHAPDEDVISPLIEDLNELTEDRVELTDEIEKLEDELSVIGNKLEDIKRQIDKKLEEKSRIKDVSHRAELASNVQNVLEDYRTELAKEKLQRLESVLSEHYLTLSNKSEFYNGIHIDKETLTISIETNHSDFNDQSQLSAGERQIFATSLLWALAEISDRPLPFIIDTPLGRLDQSHRDSLVKNFFPQASHQVLVFSTDTEIDDKHYKDLADSVSRAYHLDYQESDGYTAVSKGYFWTESAQTAEVEEVLQ
jgi:DNA sulfur modification protein DndD